MRFRVEFHYESYDFKSIPEIPFEWLLLFCIYPEVNWKIARQLKAQHKPRIPTDFSHNLFDRAEENRRQAPVLNPLTDHCCPVNLLTSVAWEGPDH